MGDMGDLFNDLKDMRKTRAEERTAEFMARKADLADKIREIAEGRRHELYTDIDASGTWNIRIYGRQAGRKGATIQYYPTKGTWQVKGRMWHGGLDSFENWITKKLEKLLF
jgi:hypothetical protein